MFQNATMLVGIGGAFVPLILHWLARSRYRTVDFSAMLFLHGQRSNHQRAARLRSAAMLGLRMLIVACIAMALAQPVMNTTRAPGEPDRIALAIVLDRSQSMSYQEAGRARYELAVQSALSVIASLREEDRVVILRTPGDTTGQPALLDPRAAAAALTVESTRSVRGRADLVGAVRSAQSVVSRVPAARREVHVLTDAQAISWAGAQPPDPQPSLDAPRVFVMTIGDGSRENLAVESLQVLNAPAVRDLPLDVSITIRNFGRTARSDVPLAITASGRELHRGSVYVPADSTITIRRTIRPPAAGSLVLRAQIETSELPYDDAFDLALDVIEPIDVLVLSDAATDGATDAGDQLLRMALAPYRAVGRRGPDVASVDAMPISQWPGSGGRRHRVIALIDPPRLSPQQVRALEQHVYEGGGLLIAPGPKLPLGQWSTDLWRGGASILPARPTMVVSADTEPDRVGELAREHPILAFARDNPDSLPGAGFSRVLDVDQLASSAQTLVSLRSGRPLMLYRSMGRGRVVLFTSSLDTSWNSLPLGSFYLPMMQSIVRYLAAGQELRRNLLLGETIVTTLPETRETQAVVTRPDGRNRRVDLIRAAGGNELRYTETDLPGRYTVRLRGAPDQQFVVQGDLTESDLSPLNDGQWRSLHWLGPIERFEEPSERLGELLRVRRGGSDLTLWLLALAAVLATVEGLLLWQWRGARR